jgi:hypothetical protein
MLGFADFLIIMMMVICLIDQIIGIGPKNPKNAKYMKEANDFLNGL